MADSKGKPEVSKRKSKSKWKSKTPTVDIKLRINVEVEQKQKKKKERVKQIRSRRRPNLREMRRGMMGGGGNPQAMASPAFYGNVKMLTDSAMNQFQNQRYALENQLREATVEQQVLQGRGRDGAVERQGREIQALQDQLRRNEQLYLGAGGQQLAQVAGHAGMAIGGAQAQAQMAQQREQELRERQGAQEQAQKQAQVKQEERQTAVSLYSDDRLKEEITKRPALRSLDFSPQAFSDAKFREVKGDIQRVLALEDPSDEAALVDRLKKTHRAQGKTESRESQVQALRLRQKVQEGSPRAPLRDFESEEEEMEESFASVGSTTPSPYGTRSRGGGGD